MNLRILKIPVLLSWNQRNDKVEMKNLSHMVIKRQQGNRDTLVADRDLPETELRKRRENLTIKNGAPNNPKILRQQAIM